MNFNEKNFKERLKFVDFWAKYVCEHDDKTWSKQQNIIINSSLKTASVNLKDYLSLKKQGKNLLIFFDDC